MSHDYGSWAKRLAFWARFHRRHQNCSRCNFVFKSPNTEASRLRAHAMYKWKMCQYQGYEAPISCQSATPIFIPLCVLWCWYSTTYLDTVIL